MNILPDGVAKVEELPTAPNNNRHNNSSEIKASVDSAARQPDAIATGSTDGKLIMAKELKQLVSFRTLLKADGHRVQQSGQYVKCCCPFHPDRTPSFFVNENDDYARCYGCDWHGNIYDYEEQWHRVDFTTAWLRLNDFYYKCPRAGRKAKSVAKKVTPDVPEFTPKQLQERQHYAKRLADESWFAELVCQRRFEKTGENWKPEVIRALAKEGSLGWAGGALAFIYPRGTKYRDWPGRDFIWECDGGSLWRGELLAGANHIYLTESETDAIALLHTDIEKRAGVTVLAISGVNAFDPQWAALFADKVVTFCFDNDKAGEEGVKRIAPLLQPYAKQLRAVDLKEVA